jgi:hypothetical protein
MYSHEVGHPNAFSINLDIVLVVFLQQTLVSMLQIKAVISEQIEPTLFGKIR